MIVTLKGPCATFTGQAKLFLGLVQRLSRRMRVEVLALDNRVVEGWPFPITRVGKGVQFGVLFGAGDKIGQLPTRYRILYTMYEATDIPRSWKIDMNIPDEVWVPTTFCRDVFSCYARTRVVPAGYENRLYCRAKWSEQDRERFWSQWCPEAIGKRVIGTAGVMSARKGIDILLAAWELAAVTDAILVVKTRDTKAALDRLPRNVCIIDRNWPDERMADFYRSIDLFVLPTRGEGLGLPPLEAAACGTPALVTRATGPVDYIDDRGIYGLEVRGTSTARNIRAEDAEWYEPSGSDLVDKLRQWSQDPPPVEHRYRDWSMDELAKGWETELLHAQRRASVPA